MNTLLALVLLAKLPVRTLSLNSPVPPKPIRIACPVGQTTRIVFPEPFVPGGVRASQGATDALGIVMESSRPVGILAVRPVNHPAQGTLTLRGTSVVLTLVLWTAGEGLGSEVRIAVVDPGEAARPVDSLPHGSAKSHGAPSAPESVSLSHREGELSRPEPPPAHQATAPGNESAVSPPTTAALRLRTIALEVPSMGRNATLASRSGAESRNPHPPVPAVDMPTLSEGLDLRGLLLARPEHIGRREGLPGQPSLTLEDALKSEKWIWLRFVLASGANSHVEEVSWEGGLIQSFYVQPSQSDLRIVVQLPRAPVTKHTRVLLKLTPGGSYRFALSAPWLSTFVRELF
jgi:hypothetical protein